MVRCSPIDDSLLEKTKLAKALQKLVKRGNEKIQNLAQSILDAAAKKAKGKANDEKESGLAESTKGLTLKQAQPSRALESATSLKRSKDSETLPKKGSSAKTTVPGKLGSVIANKQSSSAVKAGSLLKSDAKITTPPVTNGVSATKIKHVTAKPSSIFATLQSASKKPGTSNAAQKAGQNGDVKVM